MENSWDILLIVAAGWGQKIKVWSLNDFELKTNPVGQNAVSREYGDTCESTRCMLRFETRAGLVGGTLNSSTDEQQVG